MMVPRFNRRNQQFSYAKTHRPCFESSTDSAGTARPKMNGRDTAKTSSAEAFRKSGGGSAFSKTGNKKYVSEKTPGEKNTETSQKMMALTNTEVIVAFQETWHFISVDMVQESRMCSPLIRKKHCKRDAVENYPAVISMQWVRFRGREGETIENKQHCVQNLFCIGSGNVSTVQETMDLTIKYECFLDLFLHFLTYPTGTARPSISPAPQCTVPRRKILLDFPVFFAKLLESWIIRAFRYRPHYLVNRLFMICWMVYNEKWPLIPNDKLDAQLILFKFNSATNINQPKNILDVPEIGSKTSGDVLIASPNSLKQIWRMKPWVRPCSKTMPKSIHIGNRDYVYLKMFPWK